MPAAIDVDREQVRMLVLSVGVREAARKLELSEDTVKSWSLRGNWLAKPEHVLPPTVMQCRAPDAPKPADALAAALAEDERETRISLSKAARRLASASESADLGQAADVLSSAKVASLVHKWGDGSQQGATVVLNLALQCIAVQSEHPPTLDLESQ